MTNSCHASSAGPAGLLFTSLIQNLFSLQCQLGNPNDYPMDYGDQFKNNETFDFIVIGAGAAGTVVASRLAEDPTFNILLLEAGGDPNPTSDVPYLYADNLNSQLVWQYESAPNNKSCLSGKNQTCQFQQGKVLGGGTTVNGMNFVRGNKQDYDDWESYGNDGWGYEDVLPYFKKLENYGVDNEYHSSSGPMPAEPFGKTPALEKIKEIVCDSYEEIGVSRNYDFNGKRQTGCSTVRGTLVNGTRANTAKMYLKNQNNLKVVKHAVVEKIEIESGRAVGVIFHRHCQTFLVRVGKEVILSAGTIRSPQILMLSGVGPKEELDRHGITLKAVSPGVGKNLQDHLANFDLTFSIKGENAGIVANESTTDAYYEYLQKGTGLYASFKGGDSIAFVDLLHQSDVPNLQVNHLFSPKQNDPFNPFRPSGSTDDTTQQPTDPYQFEDSLKIVLILIQPKSRGEIILKSAHIADNPIIRFNYLSESEDMDAMVRFVEFARNLTKTAKFSVLEPKERFVSIDACSEFDSDSREYLQCQIRHLALGGYHTVGTCKMGPSTDPDAVVDSRLKVYGVFNLRVVDGSVMPKITRGNTMIPTVMIAEKSADLIKSDWGISEQEQ